MNHKQIAEKAYLEVMNKRVEAAKEKFLDESLRYNTSAETEDSLKLKADKVISLMNEGMDFREACDHKEVFIGSFDSSFIYDRYILKLNSLTYEEWILRRMKRSAEEYSI